MSRIVSPTGSSATPDHQRTLLRGRPLPMAGFFLGLLLLLGGCQESGAQTYELKIRDAVVEVELAATPAERAEGLMYRENLPENRGMLFAFETEAPRSFWMKNTEIPLSIAYIRSDWVILEMYDMQPRSLDPIRSRNAVRYALEVNRGWFEEHGIEAGSRVYPSDRLLAELP